MEATAIATRGPAGGQDSAKHYFEEVLEGAHLIGSVLEEYHVQVTCI